MANIIHTINKKEVIYMNLENIRKQIDIIDNKIIKLLSDRMELCLATKKFKKTLQDKNRETEILKKIEQNSKGLLDIKFSMKIFKSIIEESKRIQSENSHINLISSKETNQ